jgi:hypothetical protein
MGLAFWLSVSTSAFSLQHLAFSISPSPFPLQMAKFIQLLRHQETKSRNMLPPVAAVLPVEKGNETPVK